MTRSTPLTAKGAGLFSAKDEALRRAREITASAPKVKEDAPGLSKVTCRSTHDGELCASTSVMIVWRASEHYALPCCKKHGDWIIKNRNGLRLVAAVPSK